MAHLQPIEEIFRLDKSFFMQIFFYPKSDYFLQYSKSYLILAEIPVVGVDLEESTQNDVNDDEQVNKREEVVESGRLLYTRDK